MAKGAKWGVVGSWAFLIGVLLALVLGLWNGYNGQSMDAGITLLLIVIGLVVGVLNINGKEVTPFLMSGIVLIIASSLGAAVIAASQGDVVGFNIGAMLGSILMALLAIFVPATIIVAIKNVFALAKD